MQINFLPYFKHKGQWSLSDDFVRYAYACMVHDGVANIALADGCATNADEFLALMQSPSQQLYLGLIGEILGAVVWCNNFKKGSCEVHYATRKWTWGKYTVRLGKEFCAHILNQKDDRGYLFDILWGVTPAEHRLACRFLKRLGWVVLGTVPHGVYDASRQATVPAMISYYTREQL